MSVEEHQSDLSIVRADSWHVGVDPLVTANDSLGISDAPEGVGDRDIDRPETDDAAAAQTVAAAICGVTDAAA